MKIGLIFVSVLLIFGSLTYMGIEAAKWKNTKPNYSSSKYVKQAASGDSYKYICYGWTKGCYEGTDKVYSSWKTNTCSIGSNVSRNGCIWRVTNWEYNN